MGKNLFHDAEDVRAVVYQLVGAASMCWESVEKAGVFDDTKARHFSEEALARLEELSHG